MTKDEKNLLLALTRAIRELSRAIDYLSSNDEGMVGMPGGLDDAQMDELEDLVGKVEMG